MSRDGRIVFVDGLTSMFGAGGTVPAIPGNVVLKDPGLEAVEKTVLGHLGSKNRGFEKTVLVVDGLDLLLAATEADPFSIADMLAEWREVCYYPLANPFSFPQLLIKLLACRFYGTICCCGLTVDAIS